jgi:hypothetical protein
MIYAIAIYNLNQIRNNGSFRKMNSAKQAQDSSSHFRYDPFEQLDKDTLPFFISADRQLYKVYDIKAKNEFHYCQKVADNIVVAVSTRTALDPIERVNLFKNIEHVCLRSEKLNVTLEDIIKNPMGYTGKDILIQKVQKDADATLEEAKLSVESLIRRGESLDDLKEKAENLKLGTDGFVNAIPSTSCCKW